MTDKNSVPSYETRRAQIQTVDDIDTQLARAKRYMMKVRKEAKQAGMLDKKIELNRKALEAEKVLRKLRMKVFEIEDELAETVTG